jgi:hypothetical protein
MGQGPCKGFHGPGGEETNKYQCANGPCHFRIDSFSSEFGLLVINTSFEDPDDENMQVGPEGLGVGEKGI